MMGMDRDAALIHRLRQMEGRSRLRAAVLASVAMLAMAIAVAWQPWERRNGHVEVRDSLAAYSWEELSAISEELAECPDDAHATELAHRYGLCDVDGNLASSGLKELTLLDGSVARVRLVGLRHDERSDGGLAGLTFAFADPVHLQAMNHAFEGTEGDDADSTGGWAASDMRAWLDGTLWQELPLDLRGRILRVQKRTASGVDAGDELDEAGKLSGSAADWVRETSDRLWLFSVSELCGTVPANAAMGLDQTMSAVYGAEGDQYQLFAEYGVASLAPNRALADALAQAGGQSTWWLRTKTLEFGDGFWLLGTDGTPLNGLGEDARVVQDVTYAPDQLWGPDHARGVLVGFCL